MAVAFLDCRADDLAPLREFFARAYRPNYLLRASEELFRWQFAQPPGAAEGAYHLKLARVDGEIAGCLGYIPVEVSLCGRRAAGAWAVNWMIDPDQRRLGLGPLLMRELVRQFEVMLNVGPGEDARHILSRMGWTNFGNLTRYVSVIDAGAAAAVTETGRLEWPAAAAAAAESTVFAGLSDSIVGIIDRFNSEATDLWDRTWGRWAVGTRRSQAYLNWRYADHPLFRYRLFELRGGGGDHHLRGLAVYRIEQVQSSAVRVGRIVELIAEADGEDHLLRAVREDARREGVALLDFFCASERFAAVMARQGFCSDRDDDAALVAQIPILFQPIDRRRAGIPFMAQLPRNLDAATTCPDWYVTKGDGDQDRPN